MGELPFNIEVIARYSTDQGFPFLPKQNMNSLEFKST